MITCPKCQEQPIVGFCFLRQKFYGLCACQKFYEDTFERVSEDFRLLPKAQLETGVASATAVRSVSGGVGKPGKAR